MASLKELDERTLILGRPQSFDIERGFVKDDALRREPGELTSESRRDDVEGREITPERMEDQDVSGRCCFHAEGDERQQQKYTPEQIGGGGLRIRRQFSIPARHGEAGA